MSKTMLINSIQGHECRIAILDNGQLEELYTERSSNASHVGNIYKGRVTNIEPSIQAAFIDYGGQKNGFLHISDLHPRYFPAGKSKDVEKVGRRTSRRTRPQIQECLKKGREIVVQMTKEGIGTKGATMTTYLSLPGRMVVLMPEMKQSGISRKIEDQEARDRLKSILREINTPEDMGVIVRTAGMGRSKRDLQRDVSYLMRLWKSVEKRIHSTSAPSELYRESDLVIRTIRDIYESSMTRIVCDSRDVAKVVREFLNIALPRAKCSIEVYTGSAGLFDKFGVEDKIDEIHSRRVELKDGGYLVIDQTEALVAIDVNSGRFRQHANSETNALKLNLLAAEEIGRQLRLRDMGGVIVMDFIDMNDRSNQRTLERKLKDVLKKDRAKSKVLSISSFGLVEMTRQRLRPSLKQSIYSTCAYCDGNGLIMSDESMALKVIRTLNTACGQDTVSAVDVRVAPSVAHHLSNHLRRIISDLERKHDKQIFITADDELSGNDLNIECTSSRGTKVDWKSVSLKISSESKTEFTNINELTHRKTVAQAEKTAQDSIPEDSETGEEAKKPKKKRRRRRKKKKNSQVETDTAESPENDSADSKETGSDDKQSSTAPIKKKRRRKRSKRKKTGTKVNNDDHADQEMSADQPKPEAISSPPPDPASS